MHNPPRILVVDDLPENVEIARMRLESQGYEVVAAVDGEARKVSRASARIGRTSCCSTS